MAENTLKPEDHVFRYVFASPALFTGGFYGNDYELTLVLQQWGHRFSVERQPCYLMLSLRIVVPRQEQGGQEAVHIPTFDHLGDEFSALLGAFMGKLVVNLGPLQSIGMFQIPNPLPTFPRVRFAPMTSTARKPGNNDLNLVAAHSLLSRFNSDYGSERLGYILRASEFYRAAIELLAERPEIALTMLCSTLEALLPLKKYSEEELYDESLRAALATIGEHCGDGVVSQIRNRLFQIKRRVAAFVGQYLPDGFIEAGEREQTRFKDRAEVVNRIRAMYDLRSQLIHTGNRSGLWFLTQADPKDDVIRNSAPSLSNQDLKKAFVNSMTLMGLERVVWSILRSTIDEWIRVETK